MKTRRWCIEHEDISVWIILGIGLLIAATTFCGILALFGQAGAHNLFVL